MRHRRAGKKFGRPTNQRTALYRSLMQALFLHDRITTTEAKARGVRREAERMITLACRASKQQRQLEGATEDAKKDIQRLSVHLRRQAMMDLPDKGAVERLFKEIGPRMDTRPGGYVRIVKLGPRFGDAAPMAVLELVE